MASHITLEDRGAQLQQRPHDFHSIGGPQRSASEDRSSKDRNKRVAGGGDLLRIQGRYHHQAGSRGHQLACAATVDQRLITRAGEGAADFALGFLDCVQPNPLAPRTPAFFGYTSEHALSQIAGALVGLAGDATTIATGLLGLGSSGLLTVASGGSASAVTSIAGAASASLVGVGALGGRTHSGHLAQALQNEVRGGDVPLLNRSPPSMPDGNLKPAWIAWLLFTAQTSLTIATLAVWTLAQTVSLRPMQHDPCAGMASLAMLLAVAAQARIGVTKRVQVMIMGIIVTTAGATALAYSVVTSLGHSL